MEIKKFLIYLEKVLCDTPDGKNLVNIWEKNISQLGDINVFYDEILEYIKENPYNPSVIEKLIYIDQLTCNIEEQLYSKGDLSSAIKKYMFNYISYLKRSQKLYNSIEYEVKTLQNVIMKKVGILDKHRESKITVKSSDSTTVDISDLIEFLNDIDVKKGKDKLFNLLSKYLNNYYIQLLININDLYITSDLDGVKNYYVSNKTSIDNAIRLFKKGEQLYLKKENTKKNNEVSNIIKTDLNDNVTITDRNILSFEKLLLGIKNKYLIFLKENMAMFINDTSVKNKYIDKILTSDNISKNLFEISNYPFKFTNAQKKIINMIMTTDDTLSLSSKIYNDTSKQEFIEFNIILEDYIYNLRDTKQKNYKYNAFLSEVRRNVFEQYCCELETRDRKILLSYFQMENNNLLISEIGLRCNIDIITLKSDISGHIKRICNLNKMEDIRERRNGKLKNLH